MSPSASPISDDPAPPSVPSPPEAAPPEASRSAIATRAPAWGAARRVAFRFGFVYLALYSFPWPIDALPKLKFVGKAWMSAQHVAVPWVGKHVLRLRSDITTVTNGSGDTTFDYVLVLCMAVVALTAALVWSIVDRRARAYPRLYDAIRTYTRYVLALTMLDYGLIKVIRSQFGFPDPERLLERIGDASPMGLAWTFMGYSKPYSFFGGAMECVAAALLLFRRTTTLGALVCAAVMTNVVMMNLSYDIPVKLYSSHLLAMAIFLAAPDARRLADLLVFHRPTQPAPLRLPARWTWAARARPLVKLALVGFLVYSTFDNALESYRKWGDGAPRVALYGIYDVETFTRDGVEAAPLLTDAARWRRLTIDEDGDVAIHRMNDAIDRYACKIDDAAHTLTLTAREGKDAHVLTFARPDADHLTVEGSLDGHVQLRVVLRQVDLHGFLLVSRGFHWVQDRGLNR